MWLLGINVNQRYIGHCLIMLLCVILCKRYMYIGHGFLLKCVLYHNDYVHCVLELFMIVFTNLHGPGTCTCMCGRVQQMHLLQCRHSSTSVQFKGGRT